MSLKHLPFEETPQNQSNNKCVTSFFVTRTKLIILVWFCNTKHDWPTEVVMQPHRGVKMSVQLYRVVHFKGKFLYFQTWAVGFCVFGCGNDSYLLKVLDLAQ